MSRTKKNKLDRLLMAEIVLDSLLTVLVTKKIVTRDEIQNQITDQAKADSKSKPD